MEGDANEFILFCNQDTWIPVEHPHIKKIIIPEYLTVLWDQAFLPLYAAREKLNVFLTPYFKAPVLFPCPVVLVVNDIIPLLFPEEHSFRKRMYFEAMGAISAKNAAKIITISEHSKRDIMKYFGVQDEKIEVVYLGVEDKFKSETTGLDEIKKRYGLPDKYILYVGNLSPHKNVPGLIKAYKCLPENLRKEYKLVLGAGKSDKYYPGIVRLIAESGLDKEAIITGFIIEEHLPVIYGLSSLFVFPSLYEGFGLPPLEAMASGVPVIASGTSSIPEVVGDAAILIKPEDTREISSAMIKVLTDGNLGKSMSEKGLLRARQFTPEKMAEGFLKVLENAARK
jgi:hypothetical protein